MNVPICVLLFVQLVALSLGTSLTVGQPDGDQQNQVFVPVEHEKIADDAFDDVSNAASTESVDSMEADATYHRRYYYPRYYQRYPTYNYNTRRYYNTNPQYNRRPYYNRYPQYNYVSRPVYRPTPAYRPSTYYPGLNSVAAAILNQISASPGTIVDSSTIDHHHPHIPDPPHIPHVDPPHIPHVEPPHIPHVEPPHIPHN